MARVLVTGAAGFIGHHLCRYLRRRGHHVYGIDIVSEHGWGNVYEGCFDEFEALDCRNDVELMRLCAWYRPEHIYALAANMGGTGFISTNHWTIISDNGRINFATARAAHAAGVGRLFYASSACAYPTQLQETTEACGLKESDAWQGSPEDAYGVEKLIAEQVYLRMGEDSDCQVRIARFHNIMGPEGSWCDGREKLPAAACRKVAELATVRQGIPVTDLDTHPFYVDVWGDGEQTRSFCYIDDCVEMIYRLMISDYGQPINIGTDTLVSVNEVYDLVAEIAGIEIVKRHDLSKPQGVRGRNADLTLMRQTLGYDARVSLKDGLARTYRWIKTKVEEKHNAN